MLICQNAEEVHGQKKFGNPCIGIMKVKQQIFLSEHKAISKSLCQNFSELYFTNFSNF